MNTYIYQAALWCESCTDEIIADRIEATDPDAAIIAALKAISPSMAVDMADAVRNQPDDFAKYVLAAFKAEPVA